MLYMDEYERCWTGLICMSTYKEKSILIFLPSLLYSRVLGNEVYKSNIQILPHLHFLK